MPKIHGNERGCLGNSSKGKGVQDSRREELLCLSELAKGCRVCPRSVKRGKSARGWKVEGEVRWVELR